MSYVPAQEVLIKDTGPAMSMKLLHLVIILAEKINLFYRRQFYFLGLFIQETVVHK